MNDTVRDQPSDAMFVEWSQGRNDQNWDVAYMADYIDKMGYRTGADIGGGIGQFSNLLMGRCKGLEKIDVIDPSVSGKDAFCGVDKVHFIHSTLEEFDATQKYDFIVINLVLHHIVSDSDSDTYAGQKAFIAKASEMLNEGGVIFVEENMYQGIFGSDSGGRVIYEITKMKGIAPITRKLGANTAGEGVRFRSEASWNEIFRSVGLKELDQHVDNEWAGKFPLYQKIPLLCTNRYQTVKILQPESHSV